MKKLLQYLPFHFLICIIIGILLQFHTAIWCYDFSFLALFMLAFIGVLFLLKKNAAKKLYFTLTSLLFFVFIGISITFIHNPKNYDSYYKQHLSDNSNIIIQIHKVLKTSNYAHKYIADVIQIDTKKTIGSVLINLKKDSISTLLNVDDLIVTTAEFKNLTGALNPYQFDYREYLAKQYVYQQVFINPTNYQKLAEGKTSIYGVSEQFRNNIQTSLKEKGFKKEELSVINALLLGQRKNISKNLLQNYTNAGAVHILAISGLHIGILFLLLNSLFKPIERLKNGLLFKTIIILILLWMFAFIAGLSASVVRAVTMFTFVAVGASFKRKKVVEYSLISSMLFLLLLKPLFLFDVGFQLSYLAVFGIIWTQPLLYNLWISKFWLLDKFWRLLTVSIAAQIGILPISLYYFHQFPGLFFIANLLIIPFLGSILIGGILIIVLALLKIPLQILFDFYGWIISLMNKTVALIANQEQFLFQEISMSFYKMILWYLVIIFTYQFIINKKAKQFMLLLSSIMLLQITFIFEKNKQQKTCELIVFNKGIKNIIGIRNGSNLNILHTLDSSKTTNERSVKSYRIHENINSNFLNKIPNIIAFKNDTILIVDDLGIYNIELQNAIVILQKSPKINLERLIKELNPKKIIADASNYKSDVNLWKTICKKQKMPFYDTRKNGAFILK
ncbi:ComEC/Rec2 family competence protein [Tenacibaculum finnmarkense]|uniref:ComEC/Rec2 family competence protein n=1 Tax=Tenacibaculum finnmarkense TaxID=2781243 RepID=UPI001EFA987F|nr:ComEC/Rec2 family competence protein [Tenacibaculum finnmarkense]MCG8722116.1 ComEC/Rec2 family competence protein [Tenacibaculum finnmarkense]MCG8740439.1 ComEC/Rec2 family competence protein [Tenacibaculum finnmarkense]MCG8763832.1 ComEC/Rec2 family competence protein [Tenacibaculum finnmarkense]MCG8776587.1 ComEC/Rec2 family competence protein [Tenacibaculum finnmarkense]MCM8905302.1 ComEC/Rec2 family competence protein [Tenacibaculum finnmarkense genomovar finnmarkense]